MLVYAVEIQDNGAKRYWKTALTQRQAKRLDNGALISCGLTFQGHTGIYSLEACARLMRSASREVTAEEYNHSGCLSSCVLRGAEKCQW